MVVFLLSLLLSLGVTAPAGGSAPPAPRNQYGLPVVEQRELYRRQVAADAQSSFVDLAGFIPTIVVDSSYASDDNPVGAPLYDDDRAYLRLRVALALREAQRRLAARGVGLLVYDAYRPYSATLRLWDAVRDSAYAAPPSSGSRHNRGAAVDVGLVSLSSGRPLRMPTAYDVFSPKAAHGYVSLPAAVSARRRLLRATMERAGFVALPEEWWHYDYRGWARYPLLDVGHAALGAVPLRLDVLSMFPAQSRLWALARPLLAMGR